MFRFSIRDVLWLTALIGVTLAGVMAYNRILFVNQQLSMMVETREATIARLTAHLQIYQANYRKDHPVVPNP